MIECVSRSEFSIVKSCHLKVVILFLGEIVCVHMKTNIVDQVELLCLLTLSHVMSSRPKEVHGKGVEKSWYSKQMKVWKSIDRFRISLNRKDVKSTSDLSEI